MTDPGVPELSGIHHVKLPVADLDRSLAFYEAALGARRIPEFDHRGDDGAVYAMILKVPGLGTMLELRLNPKHAERQRGFDFLTLAVKDRATLRSWSEHLDAQGVRRSGEIVAIQAWLIAFDDPDGHRLRLYTLEQHGPDLQPNLDDPWLRN